MSELMEEFLAELNSELRGFYRECGRKPNALIIHRKDHENLIYELIKLIKDRSSTQFGDNGWNQLLGVEIYNDSLLAVKKYIGIIYLPDKHYIYTKYDTDYVCVNPLPMRMFNIKKYVSD